MLSDECSIWLVDPFTRRAKDIADIVVGRVIDGVYQISARGV